MHEEYESITKNDVWDVVPRPKDKSVVTSKWLYKIKHGVDGSTGKYKARFVAQGFSQKEGIDDDDDIFASLIYYCPCCHARMESPSDGCEECLFTWFNQGRGLCGKTYGFQSPR